MKNASIGLVALGIQNRADQAISKGNIHRQAFQGGYPHYRFIQSLGKALDGRHTNAQAGKGTGTGNDAENINILNRKTPITEQMIDGNH